MTRHSHDTPLAFLHQPHTGIPMLAGPSLTLPALYLPHFPQRTVLVDDTPLAFLHQPHNGIPMLAYRGEPEDRLLLEAVLPLVEVRRGAC